MLVLNLVTPEKSLAKQIRVQEIIVPGYFGELNILPGHSPMMTTLSEGVLSFKEEGKDEFVRAAISWGYCEVNPISVEILAETAELPVEIDKVRAQETLKNSEKALSYGSKLDPARIEKLQRKVRRARARLSAAE